MVMVTWTVAAYTGRLTAVGLSLSEISYYENNRMAQYS